ncbi:MAG TPA: hypothetical protein VJ276_25305 [Thermoanaerobaculia bacterium]|nr:hypothetical protein [Thermoanaerobaculia bacterium]
MTFFAVVGAFFFLGHELSTLMWRRFALSVWERITSGAVLGFAVWIGVTWSLAIGFHLTDRALMVAGAIAFLGAIACIRRLPRISLNITAASIIVAIPLLAWTAYLLWRGYVAPPLAPDAFTYHLPRALMFARHHGYERFALPDTRVNGLPATYELLLSTFMLLQHSDTYTEWLSTAAYLLFLAATAALVRRWWGGGTHVAVAMLVVAAAPVVLLQGAAHKNDLLACWFFLAALVFLGRWLRDGELPAAVVSLIAIACSTGLKPHGAILGFLAVPLLIWGAYRHGRHPRRTHVVAVLLLAIICVPLFGGWHYLYPRLHATAGVPAAETPFFYGIWEHLWQVPVLMWLAPFSPWDEQVWIPWDSEPWLWERYDQFASNFGWLVSLLFLALPLTMMLDRRGEHDREGVLERRVVTIVGLLLFASVLPTRFFPAGYVSSFPRYALYLAPLVAGWTIPPLLRLLRRSDAPRAELLILVLAAAMFVATAIRIADRDKWAPLAVIRWAADHPGTRWLPTFPPRAAFYLDAVAGPDDAIDVHGGDDTWIYPMYGERFGRDVRFISDVSQIRPEAKWVVVDRAFNVIWRDPRFTHIRQWHRFLGRGRATEEDWRIVRQLRDDPRFELRFLDERTVQAVFRRR